MRRRVVVAGATGLVGKALVQALVLREDVTTVALVRQKRPELDARARQVVFDYDADTSYEVLQRDGFDVLFCALGTTRKKAGSDEAFRRVDHDYPVRLFHVARALSQGPGADPSARPVIGLVSAAGTESGRGLYYRTKLDVEQELLRLGLPYVIARPSVLEGERDEQRLGEKIGVALGSVLKAVRSVSATAQKYAPIAGEAVARALIHSVLDRPHVDAILEGESLLRATT